MQHLVITDPSIHSGRPCLRGTRVPIERILRVATDVSVRTAARTWNLNEEDVVALVRMHARPGAQ